MRNKQTIIIKLKPYLQEYLKCKLDGEPLVSRKNIIGALMEPFIEYAPKDYIVCNITKLRNDENFIELPIEDGINGKRIDRAIYVSEHNQLVFQRLLTKHFDEVFISFVDDKIATTHQIKKAILLFCSFYNVPFNKVNYETLKKKYQRRKILNNIKFVHKLSLCCPSFFLM